MPQSVIRIPQPCHESWAAMTPTAAGRHCAACQKTVIDFTQLSDAEILEQLARAGRGSTCGRFRAGQLARPLQPVAVASSSGWRSWLATLLTVWGLREAGSASAAAQSPTEQRASSPVDAEQLQLKHKDNYEGSRAASFVLEGFIVDARSKEPVMGATVLVKNTPLGAGTDLAGHFSLTIPAGQALQPVEVEVHFVGYDSAVRHFVWQTPGTLQCRIELEENVAGLMEVVVAPLGLRMPPAPWHPRRLYRWSNYWLTRPFRSH